MDSCGGSNPLQQLKQQTAQDAPRAATGVRAGPAPAFRQGLARAEMAAPAAAAEWATDFQALSLEPRAGPRPAGAWGDEFAAFLRSDPRAAGPAAGAVPGAAMAPQAGPAGYSARLPPATMPRMPFMSQLRAGTGHAASDAALRSEFDRVAEQIAAEAAAEEAAERAAERAAQREAADRAADDGLSRTAGQIVDAVEYDLDRLEPETCAKFRQSSFMSLMRRVRDREVVVDGDDMVEAASGAAVRDLDPTGAAAAPPAGASASAAASAAASADDFTGESVYSQSVYGSYAAYAVHGAFPSAAETGRARRAAWEESLHSDTE
ncbi:uncharacterized protein V1510DRAFT_423016 [Dipodascopsis tothii]|uniref:uncharacterized protein n=1 Tax=Dipodascopsis tothii TaxID=44089 RepID=UPI0034CFC367